MEAIRPPNSIPAALADASRITPGKLELPTAAVHLPLSYPVVRACSEPLEVVHVGMDRDGMQIEELERTLAELDRIGTATSGHWPPYRSSTSGA